MRKDGDDRTGDDAFEAAWRDRFEEFASIRDDDAGIAGWSSAGLDARMRRFIGLWRFGRPGMRWLDAGCGAGTYTRYLFEQGADVVGVDYSLPAIRKARTRSPRRIEFAVADVRRLPFPADTFDGVVCFGVIQALSESESALRELCLLTRPGGELWVDALNRTFVINATRSLARKLRRRPAHLRYESPRALERILVRPGISRCHDILDADRTTALATVAAIRRNPAPSVDAGSGALVRPTDQPLVHRSRDEADSARGRGGDS